MLARGSSNKACSAAGPPSHDISKDARGTWALHCRCSTLSSPLSKLSFIASPLRVWTQLPISAAAIVCFHELVNRLRRPRRGSASRHARTNLNRGLGKLRALPVEATADSHIIPREVLFGNPQYFSPTLSPDGCRLAYLKPSPGGVLNVWVRTTSRMDEYQVTADNYRGVHHFQWAEDSRTLLFLQDVAGDENFHMWAIDATTPNSTACDLTPFKGVKAQCIWTSRYAPDSVLVSLNRRDPQLFDVHRINLETGETTLDTQNPGDVESWDVDETTFSVRVCSTSNPVDGSHTVRIRDDPSTGWRDLLHFPYGEEGNFLSFSEDMKTCLVESTLGRDTMALVRIDASSGEELETIAEDPRCDCVTAVLDQTSKDVLLASFNFTKLEHRFFQRQVEADFHFLEQNGPHGSEISILSRDHEDTIWVVGFRTDTGPTGYALFHRDPRSLTALGVSHPALEGHKLAPMEPVRIEARDGVELVCYLTRAGTSGKTPLVLLVHGGPWFRDVWGFNPTVQWLANRGYSVLQVNYRGSTGFGKEFLHAGDGEWGVGKMQHDLTDAVQWAVSRGIAREDNVCIYGGSYGGYACLAGLTFTPGLYCCGVDMVGISNVKTFVDSFPPYWAPFRGELLKRIGDVDADPELNRRISPLFHVSRIQAPLLIGQGANDPRVKKAESDQIVKAMVARNIPVEYFLYPDEGHWFARPSNQIDFNSRVESFLARHLGGHMEAPVGHADSTVQILASSDSSLTVL